MSEHRDVREALELAAVEPGGLDRLEAGDAPEAAMVAGHLAGCPSCVEELARLRLADTLLRPILAAGPDPALRERTLAHVRAVGVPRGAVGAHVRAVGVPRGAEPTSITVPAVHAEPAPAAANATFPAAATGAATGAARLRRRLATPAWIGAIAAALVIGVVGGNLLAGAGAPTGNADPATALAAIARETTALLAAGDAREVVLVGIRGTAGTLMLSPSAGRMVVTAIGLDVPPRGSKYTCWVEVGATRRALGTMWWAGDVAWWAGDVAIPADLPPGVVYGVSLVADGSSEPGTVVLKGAL